MESAYSQLYCTWRHDAFNHSMNNFVHMTSFNQSFIINNKKHIS